jgi:hypothetical protein
VWLGQPARDKDIAMLQELCDVVDKATLPAEEMERRLPEDLKTLPAGASPTPYFRRKSIQRKADTEAMRPYIEVRKDGVKSAGTERRQAIINLFNQPWFSRAWVVQEVLLSRAVEIMYGPFQVSLSFLERISSSVADLENQTLGWRYILFNTTSGYDAFQMIMNAKDDLVVNGRVDNHFLNFMWAMQRSTKSTDPRDKVFAFMGIKPPDSPPFVMPSYIRSAAEIYMDAARSWIEETKDLTVFSIVEGNEVWTCKCNNPIPGLPSWAPNWSQVSRHVILYLSVSCC